MAQNDHLRLFVEGDVLYAAMLAAIAAAQSSVLLETYIFADDEIGLQFAGALIQAAQRGLDVRVHIDAAGSLFWYSQALALKMQRGGVRLKWFHRWSWRQPWRYNRRNHRKMLVLDQQQLFLGGFNIHRENSRTLYGEQRWRDTHLCIQGHFAEQSARLFDVFWRGKRRAWVSPLPSGDMLMSNHTRASRLAMRAIYRDGFAGARQCIDVTTPYFVPDTRTRQALVMAALRGVQVRLLLPAKIDVKIARWAAHASYARLLAAGVNIYEYQPRVLHAKVVAIDGHWATVGTANIDYRSFFVNYELNLISADVDFCRELQQQFEYDVKQSVQIQALQWAQRSWLQKWLERVAWLVRRWL